MSAPLIAYFIIMETAQEEHKEASNVTLIMWMVDENINVDTKNYAEIYIHTYTVQRKLHNCEFENIVETLFIDNIYRYISWTPTSATDQICSCQGTTGNIDKIAR
tara:strand:- start:102 stop:416 length:315 start_codon:yes stop_codon:yes gene_type:complete